jgi:hypothetical protein
MGVIAGQFPDANNVFPEEQSGFGPGGFSASWINATGYFANFPVNVGPAVNTSPPPVATDVGTQLFTNCGFATPTAVALLNDTTPVAECDSFNSSGGSPASHDTSASSGTGLRSRSAGTAPRAPHDM